MSTYLDHNATTPLDERVLEAMHPFLTASYGNPSSVHGFGRHMRRAVDNAREQLAALVNAHPSQVIFTSGGTEANNMVFSGLAQRQPPGRVLISTIEHPSVLRGTKHMDRLKWQIERIPVDQAGRVEVDTLAGMIDSQTRLVSIMAANNETGTIQDIEALAATCREHNAVFHCDAVQALGKIKVDFPASMAHLMSLSSHKIYGPQGCGALVVEKSIDLAPLMYGGGQERTRRAGTENVAAIVGFGRAAEIAANELEKNRQQLLLLRQLLEQMLQTIEGVVLFATQAERLPNTVMFAVEGVAGETMLMALDEMGFAVSSGAACESTKGEPSHVLTAMGVSYELAQASIRISLGRANTAQDVENVVVALKHKILMMRSVARY
ncbi:MAG: cysteine desulfurase [Gammaproteobacteria bacterium]|nr:cysteine desulfurase [Gammaproteobacteria bacterium]MCF6230894.1 cysteine desulfurase [Gammaproteobacteria bacterium]